MIEFAGVGRTYAPLGGRRVRAVDDMTFTVRAGEVFGIAGPNGAGKSTMISMLLGFMSPSEGRVTVDGRAPRQFVEREGIGYLSELVEINPRWRARDAMVRFAILAGIPARAMDASVNEAMTLMSLEEHAGKRVKELSKGTRQRLALGQALLGDSRVLVLDEPTHGLDPLWTQRFRELVPTLRRPDRAIVIASHNLDELERLADRVAIVDRGRLQRIVETRGGVSDTAVTRYRIAYRGGEEAVREVFPGATSLAPGEVEVDVAGLEGLNRGLAALIERGVLVVAATPAYSVLEEHFRQAVRSDA
ncbi:MAG: ABC transporter ATP-binding protein [Gemmatimonadaceae bacterium]|nr:ABC transporter ATP-binding protein [Gemmatimonadaceae bacterium]NUQ94561.1 ABC transporter ATP-binding protein [Gemmatimonadaceae bacterium]NUR18298.1 ABC transporter ATP-binding protein [Gemmatimonadaceae bacterium]NUS97887.1 ABC transporter ATP-binding protein [Gemmatimonadaceae bacterium]